MVGPANLGAVGSVLAVVCKCGCNNSQQRWPMKRVGLSREVIALLSPRRPSVMHVPVHNNVGRALKTVPTLLCYFAVIKEQKKCATIGIHSARRASSSRINVLTGEVGSGATVMPTSSSSTEAPTRQQGSFRFPDNCPDADCDFLVTYQASGANSVAFELRGRGNWAGVGFSEDNQMPDTDILICASDTSLSGHYYATGRSTPARTDPTPPAVEIADQSFNGGVVSCRITRDVNPGLANFRNLEEQQFLLGAIGGLSGGTIMIHSDRRASGSRINVVRSEVVSGVTVMPTSSSSTVRLYFIFLPY
ncbi:uncharacterized protein [Porites lutea]|uniref:uncharacterized protein n=1 Tax=Porites lutea TaxID=51062 RepID=UPI003CC6C543